MFYQQQAPSTAWEPVMIPDTLQGVIWVWNKPGHDPHSLQIEIPWETCMAARDKLSVQEVSLLLKFTLNELTGWSIQGYFYQNIPAHHLVFTQLLTAQINHPITLTLHWMPVPEQVALPQTDPRFLPIPSINDFVITGPQAVNKTKEAISPQIAHAQHVATAQQTGMSLNQILQQAPAFQLPNNVAPMVNSVAMGHQLPINYQAPSQPAKAVIHNQDVVPADTPEYARQIFKSDQQGNMALTEISADELRIHLQQMAADWTSIIQMERQLSTVRKTMDGLITRINSLNRDLTPEEVNGCDSMDKKDWQDARRWLRDSITTLNRYMREYDVGLTSNAGNRNRFEVIYDEYLLQKKAFPDILNIRKEFELHRKLVHNLCIAMQTAVANATRDGENRARNLLNRISSKARSKRRNS